MRVAGALVCLLHRELVSGEEVSRVETYRTQDEEVDWHRIVFRKSGADVLRAVLRVVGPLGAGEALLDVESGVALVSPDGCLVEEHPLEASAVVDLRLHAPFSLESGREQDGRIVVVRLARDGRFRDLDSVVARLRSETWLGMRALTAGHERRELELVLGAQRRVVGIVMEAPIAIAALGDTRLAVCSGDPSQSVDIRVWVLGEAIVMMKFSTSEILNAIGVPVDKYYGFSVDLPLGIEVYMKRRPVRSELVSLIRDFSSELSAARDLCEVAIESSVRATTQRLEDRRKAIAGRESICIQSGGRSEYIGTVPRNENEVLMLMGKIHTYVGRIIPKFEILEHTALLGIDALADIQLFHDGSVIRSATVEFEFSLDNFFRHQHPIRLTSFIICWKIGRLPETVGYRNSEVGHEDVHASQARVILCGTGWRRRLNFGDHIIHILVLELLPGLKVVST